MKVILAVDFSSYSEAAIQSVENRPWPENTQIAVIHVVNLAPVGYDWSTPASYLELETKDAEKLVGAVAKRLSAKGLRVTPLVFCGYPNGIIPDYAREWKADLVILGSHGATALVRFLLGSVARSVLRTAHCSVEIVRSVEHRQPRAAMRILLAIDGSECSDRAARAVAERSWPEGSVVRAMSAIDLPPVGVDAWNSVSVIEKHRAERTRVVRKVLERTVKSLSVPGLKAESEVFYANPKAAIVDEARRWDADLVVVGSHGRHGLDRLMLGSVAEAVALHSHCSVAVIR